MRPLHIALPDAWADHGDAHGRGWNYAFEHGYLKCLPPGYRKPPTRIALFFTGRQHAGENIADVLKQRSAELPAPVQMCDASSSNTSAYPKGVKILLANCLAHGRRQFVEVMANFPSEYRPVLEKLGSVYHNDALVRRGKMSGDERLRIPPRAQPTGDGSARSVDEGAVGRAPHRA